MSVNLNCAIAGIVETGDEIDDSALPGTAMSNQPDHLASFSTETDTVQRVLLSIVREIDIFKFNGALHLFQRDSILFICHTRRRVKDFKHPVGGSCGAHEPFVHVAQCVDRPEEPMHQVLEHEQLAQREFAVEYLLSANEPD